MPDDDTTPAEDPQDATPDEPSSDEGASSDESPEIEGSAAEGEGSAPESDDSVEEALGDAQATVDDTQAVVEEAASDAMAGASEDSSAEPDAFSMPEFSADAPGADSAAIELLSDVNLNVKIELGRTRLLVEDVLKLGEGAVVELDKLAGDPVDIFVNDRHVARGEVLVLNDNFCIRVSEILDGIGEAANEASSGAA